MIQKWGDVSSVAKQKNRKAREDQILNDSRRNTGALGIATELLGGGVAGGGLANADLTTGRLLSSAPGLLGRTATSAADAAALGAVLVSTKATV